MGNSVQSYSLRQVVELTGLSEFTLRGWENRYRAFSPRRNSTGRRRYTLNELNKALRLRELVQRGHRIGQIASLSVRRLDELLEGGGSVPPAEIPSEVEEALRLVAVQEWKSLEEFLRQKTSRSRTLAALREFVIPLLREMGVRVDAGEISIAQEHVLSAFLRQRIYALGDARPPSSRPECFVIAGPEGDFHELGLLAAQALVINRGFRSLYMGPNSPKNELCETALRFGATHVLLGSTVSRAEGAKEDFLSYLNFADRHLPRELSLWFGGRHGFSQKVVLRRKTLALASLLELDGALVSLDDARTKGR